MQQSAASQIVDRYCKTHLRILTLAEKVNSDELRWRAAENSHSIAFHLWHIARWADYMQAAFPGMTPILQQQFGSRPQLWLRDNLAARWGFTAEQLGYAETGMTMPDELARTLPFPEKSELLAYVRAAFAAVEEVVRAIDETQLLAPEQPQPMTEGVWEEGTVVGALVDHVIHDNRHLGTMECLYGLQTGAGTATV